MDEELTDAQLVARHKGRVESIAKALARELRMLDRVDDLVAYGYQGLFEAHRRFDRDAKVPFAGYMHYRVRGAMLDGARVMGGISRRGLRRALRAMDAILESAGVDRALIGPEERTDAAAEGFQSVFGQLTGSMMVAHFSEQQHDPAMRFEQEEKKHRVRRAIEALPERERRIVNALYVDEQTLEEIAAAIGISSSWASRLHSGALEMLGEALE